jgi:predicted alternative tryptophan synthase beta-subunit
MENPRHIFISYSSKDRSLIEKIHLALKAADFNVWREQTRLETHTGAADWSREIAFALADCDVVCLM